MQPVIKEANILNHSIVGCILAALPSILIAWINYRLTGRAAKSGSTSLSLVPVLRMVLGIGYLAVLYFAAPYTPWDEIWLLAGGAVGLTVPMFLFTFLLLRQVNGQTTGSAPDTPEKNNIPKEGGDS